MSFLDSVADIINKFVPSRKAATVDELNDLLVQYDKALELGEDTKASLLRKRMRKLREKLGYTEGDI